MIGAPIIVIALLEVCLGILGIGGPPSFFVRDPNNTALLIRGPRYHPFFASPPPPHRAIKPNNGFRVAIVGESTVAGYPLFFATLTDRLQIKLHDLLPKRVCEVLNGGVVGATLGRLQFVLRACLDQHPDVVVLMVGHNEEAISENALALRSQLERPWQSSVLGFLRNRHLAWLIAPHFADTRNLKWPVATRDQPHLGVEADLVRTEFERLLSVSLESIRASNAYPIVCTMPRRLRELAPLGSGFRAETTLESRARLNEALGQGESSLAASSLEKALNLSDQCLAIDSSSADAHYLRARSLESLGNCDGARTEYRQALELDIWPQRAREWVQSTIRRVAVQRAITLIDLEELFDSRGFCAMAGSELLGDDVHPTFSGHQLIADTILDVLANEGIPIPKDQWAWAQLRNNDELEGSFGTPDAFAFALARAVGYAYLFEAFALPAGEREQSRRKAQSAKESLSRALTFRPQDMRVAMLLGVAEILSGDQDAGARRLQAVLPIDPAITNEFFRIVETGPGLRKVLADAGIRPRP